MEAKVAEMNKEMQDLSLEQLDVFWEEQNKQSVNRGFNMRLDKFLKVSRLIKRRTLAKEVADQGRISINGQVAKASSDVKVADELTIRFGQK